MSDPTIAFVKGHGTGNDFVILSNADGRLRVSPSVVAALCDRRRGIGADGVLVVARTAAEPEVAEQAVEAPWFMDYRNADGSTAQMCGNGARVFAAHLVQSGLVDTPRFQIATRGGVRSVVREESGDFCVDMGEPTLLDTSAVTVRPHEVADGPPGWPVTGVLIPNPHAVAFVDDLDQAGELSRAPRVQPAESYPEGVNVEFVRILAEDHIELRVFERGVGETLSCGTGACAAAVAALLRAGRGPGAPTVRVDVPGGAVRVTWQRSGSVLLAGPAVTVARGRIDPEWWATYA